MWPFRTKPAPAIEAKSLAAPDEELLALLGATVTGTAAVPTSVALTVPAVAAAVRTISEAAASLEVLVERRDGDAWVPDEEHPAWHLLRVDACPWASGFETIRDLVAECLTRDAGGFAYVSRVDGKPAEIITYRDNPFSVEYAETGEPTYRLSGAVIPTANVIHLRGPFSKSPLTLCAEAIGLANVLEKHAAKLFTNGARPGGVIQFPKDVKIGDAALAKMRTAWKSAFEGSDNAGKTALLWDGGTFNPLTFNSVDSQFLETRRFQLEEVARAFNIPSPLLGDLTRATWSNLSTKNREFLVYCLEPWLQALEAALRRALIDEGDRKDFRIRFDRDDLTRADLGERATAYSTLVTARIYSPNELRAWDGAPPYPGGDEFANPAITPGPAAPVADNNDTPEKEAAA
ncbi:phage portal protein [Mesorhizobium sp. SP-1A]|uniref:phage portal protein n=1 Tax=Mesorhizobium sp. SP-1A TaxID=3077840 RepID=UPI0028F6FDE4|nr:phage portal protein [Mesorhizobium sp. SP-1A]